MPCFVTSLGFCLSRRKKKYGPAERSSPRRPPTEPSTRAPLPGKPEPVHHLLDLPPLPRWPEGRGAAVRAGTRPGSTVRAAFGGLPRPARGSPCGPGRCSPGTRRGRPLPRSAPARSPCGPRRRRSATGGTSRTSLAVPVVDQVRLELEARHPAHRALAQAAVDHLRAGRRPVHGAVAGPAPVRQGVVLPGDQPPQVRDAVRHRQFVVPGNQGRAPFLRDVPVEVPRHVGGGSCSARRRPRPSPGPRGARRSGSGSSRCPPAHSTPPSRGTGPSRPPPPRASRRCTCVRRGPLPRLEVLDAPHEAFPSAGERRMSSTR